MGLFSLVEDLIFPYSVSALKRNLWQGDATLSALTVRALLGAMEQEERQSYQ
jgi:hypothetical protein